MFFNVANATASLLEEIRSKDQNKTEPAELRVPREFNSSTVGAPLFLC
jgi:hypothetical protein